jgi:hypothetical protein
MSALLWSEVLLSPTRPYSELEATREISRCASIAVRIDSGLDALATTALRVPGVNRICIEQAPELTDVARLDWQVGQAVDHPLGRAVAGISAAGQTRGQLGLFFELQTQSVECPVCFARFVAQQIASMLERIALLRQRDSLSSQSDKLRTRLRTRKAVHRARGILAQTRGITEAEAMAFLVAYARESRRGLGLVAEGVILNHADTSPKRPTTNITKRTTLRPCGPTAVAVPGDIPSEVIQETVRRRASRICS